MYNEIQKKEYLETLKKNSEATAITFEYSLKQFAPVERMLKKRSVRIFISGFCNAVQ